MSILVWLADTLWVFDSVNRRFTFVSPSRTLVRVTDPLPGTGTPPPEAAGRIPLFFPTFPEAMATDGSVLATLDVSERQIVPEPFENRLSLGTIGIDGVVDRILAIMPPIEGAMPFQNRRVYDASPTGDRVAYAMSAFAGEHGSGSASEPLLQDVPSSPSHRTATLSVRSYCLPEAASRLPRRSVSGHWSRTASGSRVSYATAFGGSDRIRLLLHAATLNMSSRRA